MRKSGILVQWNNQGGYGFVREDEAGRDFYVHISTLAENHRPRIGDKLSFEIGKGRKGKPVAQAVTIVETTPAPQPTLRDMKPPAHISRFRLGLRTAAATLMTLLILWAIGMERAPVWIGLLYAAMGLGSALLYRFDKLYAMSGKYRVSENNLHLVDLCFGIIGGLAAQEVYRHKTVKPGFVAGTWAIALVHTLGLAALAFGWLHGVLT
nr:DUF1294 domain-containing protein [uncultured Devosia sp.]